MKIHRSLLAVLFVTFCLATQGFAQEKPAGGDEKKAHAPGEVHHGKSADEIGRELANPNNAIAKLTFKNQYRWYEGDLPGANDQGNYTLLFQPVFPFTLGTKASGTKPLIFCRPAIPIVANQPIPKQIDDQFIWENNSGLGDIVMDLAYAETLKSGFLWAFGTVMTFPTAIDEDLQGGQWRMGPEALVAKITKTSLIGVFPSHQWNLGGWNDNDYSVTSCQFFLTAIPGGGWTVGTQPTMTYDWEGGGWTIPLHVTVTKTAILGSHPYKFEVELNYYVMQPDDFGPQAMISFNITPIVVNFLDRWVKSIF